MENQFPINDMNHGISSDNSRKNLISLVCVSGTLMNLLGAQRNLEEVTKSKRKCNYSKMWWMNVILLILDSQAIGLHGRSTSLQVIPYESDLIGL